MKCLVLFLAVAVCRGAILRQGAPSPLMQEEPGVIKPRVWKYDPLRSRPLMGRLHPFTVEPWTTQDVYQGFQDDILGNEFPFTRTIVNQKLNYETFRDLLKFPGSEFLEEEIEKYLNGLTTTADMSTENVRDYDLLPMTVQKLQEKVPQYMQMFRDPSTMAQVITRDVVKVVLNARMHCGTSIWDVNFIKRIQNKVVRTLYKTEHQLKDSLRTEFQQMPIESEMIEQFVYGITSDLQQHLYKHLVQYVQGVGFKDVAVLSHKLYYGLKRSLEEVGTQAPEMLMQQIVSIVTDAITKYETCPRTEEISKKTEQACWDFNNLFVEREVARLYSRFETIVHYIAKKLCYGKECKMYLDQQVFPNVLLTPDQKFVPSQYNRRFIANQYYTNEQDYPRMTQIVKRMIKQYILTVVQGVSVCQAPICWDPSTCSLDQTIGLGSNEMTYLKNILQQTSKPFWMKMYQVSGY